MNIDVNIKEKAELAKKASILLAAEGSEKKDKALGEIITALKERKDEILKANREDLERSQKGNLAMPLMKRLKFDEGKLNDAAEGIESLIRIPEPVGMTLAATELDEGLELYKVSCPIGVIG